MAFDSKPLGKAPDVIAPDGSEVRLLCHVAGGSMAHFTLPPGAIAKAVTHRSVEEIWYVISGRGRMWRKDMGNDPGHEAVTTLEPGLSLTIPLGTHFQFRCDGEESLQAVAITIPPWPNMEEAYEVPGPWVPTE